MEVMEQHIQIIRCNQEIIHSQRNETLFEFSNVPVYPPIPDAYALLTPAELAAIGISPAHAPDNNNNNNNNNNNDDDDEEAANDNEETEDDE
jgi:hypothetical protein